MNKSKLLSIGGLVLLFSVLSGLSSYHLLTKENTSSMSLVSNSRDNLKSVFHSSVDSLSEQTDGDDGEDDPYKGDYPTVREQSHDRVRGDLGSLTLRPQKVEYNLKDVKDYFGSRYLHLMVDSSGKYRGEGGLNDWSTYTGVGFVLGAATEGTLGGQENLYWVGSDLKTVEKLTSTDHHNILAHYGHMPYSEHDAQQEFYHVSVESNWSYKAVGLHFENKPGGFKDLSDEDLGLNFGVVLMDLSPLKSGRLTPGVQSQSYSKLKVAGLFNGHQKHLDKLRDSVNKYGDTDLKDHDLDKGYMFSEGYRDPNSLSPDVRQITGLKQKGHKRVYDPNDKLTVNGRNYWSPTYDYNIGDAKDPVGSPLLYYRPDQHNIKKQFAFGGLVTKDGYVSKLMHYNDYDPVTFSGSKSKTLCSSINELKYSTTTSWLVQSGSSVQFRTPTFCNPNY